MARYLYEWPSGAPRYYVDGETVYELTGNPAFYIQDKTVYAYRDGKPTFWIDGKHLYKYGGGGKPALYFDLLA
jgi:hypothetical protein